MFGVYAYIVVGFSYMKDDVKSRVLPRRPNSQTKVILNMPTSIELFRTTPVETINVSELPDSDHDGVESTERVVPFQ